MKKPVNKVALTILFLLAAYLSPFGSPVFGQTSSAICALPEVTNISLAPAMLKGPSDFDPIYTYDLNGNRTSMIDPTGITTYTYDALNRLTSITNNRGLTTTFTYDSLGRRTSMTHANGVVTTYEYDKGSQLTKVTHQLGTTIINSFSYSYDRVGNRKTKADRNGTASYTYDTLNRLIEAINPLPTNPLETYQYDAVGNRTDSNQNGLSRFNAVNQLEEDATFRYQYDRNGNLIQKTNKTTGEIATYEYTAENQLVRVVKNGTVINYRFDGLGRRVEKEVNDGATTKVTRFIFDIEDILLELDGNNNIIARYTHGPGIDEPLVMEKGGASFFYHADGLGSITEITNQSGTLVQAYTHSSFGKIESQLDPNFVQPYTFTAREFDSETGLYFYRARYYDPTVGRFLQQDPFAGFVRAPESLNRYPYALNNPQSLVDPDAELPTLADLIGGAIVGAGAGAISGAASGSRGGITGAILGGVLSGTAGIFTGALGAALTNLAGGGVAGAITGELVGSFIGELLGPSQLGKGVIPVIRNAPPFDQQIRNLRPPRPRKPVPELRQLRRPEESAPPAICPIPG